MPSFCLVLCFTYFTTTVRLLLLRSSSAQGCLPSSLQRGRLFCFFAVHSKEATEESISRLVEAEIKGSYHLKVKPCCVHSTRSTRMCLHRAISDGVRGFQQDVDALVLRLFESMNNLRFTWAVNVPKKPSTKSCKSETNWWHVPCSTCSSQ